LKDPNAFAARADTEMKKLISQELAAWREAILVRVTGQPQGDDTRADGAYEDATHRHLDQVDPQSPGCQAPLVLAQAGRHLLSKHE
jgi:hypothetical protein